MRTAEWREVYAWPDEYAFTDWVIKVAITCGWQVAHFRPARTARGWVTPIQGHKGFPDLCLSRNGVVLFRELKMARGTLSPDQRQWSQHLPEQLYAVWRPADRDLILATLNQTHTGAAA